MGDRMKQLHDLAVRAGWEVSHVDNGWKAVTPEREGKGRQSVVISRRDQGRNYANALGVMRRYGVYDDLARAELAKGAKKRRKIVADRDRNGQATATIVAGAPAVPAAVFHPAATPPGPDPGYSRAQAERDELRAALIEAGLNPDLVDPRMVTKTEAITPERAAFLLAIETAKTPTGPIHQRRTDFNVVEEYTEAMERGEWAPAHPEGIVLAPPDPDIHEIGDMNPHDGFVLDGMHRLNAVILSGRTIVARVTYYCPPELFDKLNIGKRRTGADMLTIAGEQNSFHLSSALKTIFCWEEWARDPEGRFGAWQNWGRLRATNHQLHDVLVRHPGVRDVVQAGSTMVNKVRGIAASGITFQYLTRSAITGQFPWHGPSGGELPEILANLAGTSATYTPEQRAAALDRLDQFTTAVREGRMLDLGDPPLTLRNWLLAGGGTKGGPRREEQLIAMFKAWEKYAQNRELRAIRLEREQPMLAPTLPKFRGRST